MVTYHGRRGEKGAYHVLRCENGVYAPLSLRLDLAGHSATGFAWGYGGSGPAQLALALLADCLPDDADLAYELHQSLKWRLVATMPKDGWIIDQWEIEDWIFHQLDQWSWTTERIGAA